MSSKQIKSRLEKLSAKIKTKQADLAGLRTQAKGLKEELATARATEKAKKAAKG
jgi:septal ring factor EnvC (AmiA/AmiB activator)